MRAHRLAGPDRARLAGRIIADGEDEVETGRAGLREFVPAFRAQAGRIESEFIEKRERLRMDIAFGEAARANSAETPFAIAVQQCFGQARACAVSCAPEPHIINLVGHHCLLIAALRSPERSIL